MLCFFLLLKKPPLILAAEHSRGVWRSLGLSPVCVLKASVSPWWLHVGLVKRSIAGLWSKQRGAGDSFSLIQWSIP